ncbi:MAG: sigma-70 family RNA polymerase sigma factor [Rubrivivax sp.]|nr:sigma-70 family RNA polymerase sigma factor [Rubrivivax sp.]
MPGATQTPREPPVPVGAPGSLDAAPPPGFDDRHEARDRQLAAWLAGAAAGDAAAFESFYEVTFAHARTVARRLLRDSAEVEDLLADCYFEAWQKAGRFDPRRGNPVTWLLTLVRSRGLDALRAAAARPGHAPGGAATEDLAGAEPADPAADADPAERLWRRQASAGLHAALATLTPPERWVLGLAYLRELSHGEIARCTGLPLGTVKSHALRAQNKLRSVLGGARAGPAAA